MNGIQIDVPEVEALGYTITLQDRGPEAEPVQRYHWRLYRSGELEGGLCFRLASDELAAYLSVLAGILRDSKNPLRQTVESLTSQQKEKN